MTMTGMLILDAIMTHCISSMTTIRASSTIHQAAHHHRQPAMVRRDGIYIWGTWQYQYHYLKCGVCTPVSINANPTQSVIGGWLGWVVAQLVRRAGGVDTAILFVSCCLHWLACWRVSIFFVVCGLVVRWHFSSKHLSPSTDTQHRQSTEHRERAQREHKQSTEHFTSTEHRQSTKCSINLSAQASLKCAGVQVCVQTTRMPNLKRGHRHRQWPWHRQWHRQWHRPSTEGVIPAPHKVRLPPAVIFHGNQTWPGEIAVSGWPRQSVVSCAYLIVNCSEVCEVDYQVRPNQKYQHLNVFHINVDVSSGVPPHAERVSTALDAILAALKEGQRVHLHCKQGAFVCFSSICKFHSFVLCFLPVHCSFHIALQHLL